MEKAENISKYLLFLDINRDIFLGEIVNIKGIDCYEGNVRLNKYLHIMQMVYIGLYSSKLFEDNMYAYKNGVVIGSVMNRYRYLWKHKDEYNFNNEEVKVYVWKMFNILKNISLDELINISEKDREWLRKHNASSRLEQLMNIDNEYDYYKVICMKFIVALKKAK